MSNENNPLSQLFGLMPNIKRPVWRNLSEFKHGVNIPDEQDIEYFNNKLNLAISPKAKARILRQIILLSYVNIIKKHCI